MKKVSIILFVLITAMVLQAGQTLPMFKLRNLNNQWRQFEDVKGERLTVIDFWATWCGPCKRAIPKLNDMYATYQSEGVNFVGLNVDSPRNTAKIPAFVAAHKIEYPVLKDPDGALSSKLSISAIPTLLIVNSEREIMYRHTGYRPGDDKVIEAELKKLLSEYESE